MKSKILLGIITFILIISATIMVNAQEVRQGYGTTLTFTCENSVTNKVCTGTCTIDLKDIYGSIVNETNITLSNGIVSVNYNKTQNYFNQLGTQYATAYCSDGTYSDTGTKIIDVTGSGREQNGSTLTGTSYIMGAQDNEGGGSTDFYIGQLGGSIGGTGNLLTFSQGDLAVYFGASDTYNTFQGTTNHFNGNIAFDLNGAKNLTGVDLLSSNKIKVTGNVNATGNVTALYLMGDGSLLSNLPTTGNSSYPTFTQLYAYNYYNSTNPPPGGNASWNQSLATSLYAPIAWAYNQTTDAVTIIMANINANNTAWLSTYNATYAPWAYNQTTDAVNIIKAVGYYNRSNIPTTGNSSYLLIGGTTWNDTSNRFNKTYADTLYSAITWNYNQTTDAVTIVKANGFYNSSNIPTTGNSSYELTSAFVTYTQKADGVTANGTVWDQNASQKIWNMTVAANTNYTFKCLLWTITGAATTGVQYNLSTPSSPATFNVVFNAPNTTIMPIYTYCQGTTDSCAEMGIADLTTGSPVYIEGRLENVNAGGLLLRMKSEVPGSAVTTKKGSYCDLYQEG